MNDLLVFKNELFEVAARLDNGEIVFDVEHVAKCLGFTQVKNSKEYVRWERVNEYLKKVSPQVGKGDFIPEPLVYKLAFKADNEVAENFQDWLAIEVIPSIRKNGGYLVTNEDDTDEDILAKAVLVAQKTIERKNQIITAQKQKLEEQQPFVSFAKICMQSNQSIKVGEFAKMMASHSVNDIGQNRLFIRLREWGFIFKNSTEPTQKAIDNGYFEIAQGVKQKTKWRSIYMDNALYNSKRTSIYC